MDIHIVSCLKF